MPRNDFRYGVYVLYIVMVFKRGGNSMEEDILWCVLIRTNFRIVIYLIFT